MRRENQTKGLSRELAYLLFEGILQRLLVVIQIEQEAQARIFFNRCVVAAILTSFCLTNVRLTSVLCA